MSTALWAGDLSRQVIAFVRALRGAGVDSGPGDSALAVALLARLDLSDRREVYLALRCLLARDPGAQRVFDRLFPRFFPPAAEGGTPAPDGTAEEEGDETPGPGGGGRGADADAVVKGEATGGYSPAELAAARPLPTLPAALLAELGRAARRFARALATLPGRRWQPGGRGRIDLRRSLRRSLGTGGLPLKLLERSRRPGRARLVLLLDVSRSMDGQTVPLLRFAHALQSRRVAVQTYLFSTALVRVTPRLLHGDFARVLAALAPLLGHWSGGTRIGQCLSAFADGPGSAVLSAQTVVVIASDGWDTGDAALVGAAMARLRQRCAAVIWLNPLAGMPFFSPTAAGMAAAMPYIDRLLPAGSAAEIIRLPDRWRGA